MTTAFVDTLMSYILSLRRQGRPLFSPPIQWVILSNGDADFHDSIIFFGFEGTKSEPSLVVKVPRLPENGWALQVEYDRLVELWEHLGAEAVFRLPEPIAMVTLEKQPALVISYLPGESLLRSSKGKLWGNSEKVLALAVGAAQSLRDLNDRTATQLGDGERVPTDFQQKVEKFKKIYILTEHEDQILVSLVKHTESVAAMASHKVLIQGDFWHGNMIRNAVYGNLMFVDWQYSLWSTDVSLDVYLFLLAGALAATPQGSVEERARETMEVLLQWRPKIIPAYLDAYGRPDRYTLLPARYGMLVCCVEKAVRSSLDCGYNQADAAIWRLLFAELINLPEGNGFYDDI